MRAIRVSGLLAALMVAGTAGAAPDLWPWNAQNPAQPPAVQPYQIPTFAGSERDFRGPSPDWVRAPRIDGDAIYAAVIACYPERSRWQLDLNLEAALRSSAAVDVTGTSLGRAMVGLVARMPIYSDSELDKDRVREYQRRVQSASTVAEFVRSIAERNQSVRALALYGSLEQRARVRVAEGIVPADEQIGYLDKVAGAERDLMSREGAIMAARLTLVAMCRSGEADRVNRYLTGLAQLPTTARP